MIRYEKRILKDLYESVNGLFAFTFYSRYKIEPDQIFQFIDKYQKRGLLVFESDKLTLTKEGRELILKQRFITASKGERDHIPKRFKGDKIGVNVPILPDISKVSPEILKLETKKKVE